MNVYEYQRKHLAMAAVALADKIEADFITREGGLATYLLACARNQAADALMALVDIDPNDTETIRKLQNDVQRQRDLTEWMARAAEDGREAWQELSAGEQDAIARVIDPQEQD